MAMGRAVFVDRDGVICHNRSDYVKSWEEFVFLPGAREALAGLAQSDFHIVVVTNQSAINRGLVSVDVVEDIHARMTRAIRAAGGRVDRLIYCPHRPDERCDCRKPQPGMLLTTAKELQVDLNRSFLIGDAETDVQAGRAAGCQCYLVLTGRGRRQLIKCRMHGERDFRVVPNLGAAVRAILRRDAGVTSPIRLLRRDASCG